MGFGGGIFKAAPCPGCGKPDAARMGNPSWGPHDRGIIMACSEACGERVGEAIYAARATDRYRFFKQMMDHAEENMAAIESEEIDEARERASSATSDKS